MGVSRPETSLLLAGFSESSSAEGLHNHAIYSVGLRLRACRLTGFGRIKGSPIRDGSLSLSHILCLSLSLSLSLSVSVLRYAPQVPKGPAKLEISRIL